MMAYVCLLYVSPSRAGKALPAVASIMAVKPLLRTIHSNTNDLFYTKANAMSLRANHADPFTDRTLHFLPPELPDIQMSSCAVGY
jgi:hypothetical protein